jgi:superfamily II DNA or RNA helicase
VLPTGAGKTVIALKAIEELRVATLIVVPTLVLLEQWRKKLEEEFGISVGTVGGGRVDIKPITVTTYDSASIKAQSMGNIFRFLVFDEVHHLPAKSYRRIALTYIAPYRMGLTATLARDDGAHEDLSFLVGDVVYEMEVDDLAGDHLAEYTVQTVHIPLSPEEQVEYDRNYTRYRSFLHKRGIRIRSARNYQRFVMRSGRDPEARRALLSRNRAMDLAQNSSSKVEYLKGLLEKYRDEKALIFTRHNKLVYRISREMLIPAITHQTPKEEREEILDGFRSGRYLRLVTSQVLDEGVDVPDASLAVILSGTGSSRQFIQRLGRVLRKKDNKNARMVELVSMGTAETRTSRRRKRR